MTVTESLLEDLKRKEFDFYFESDSDTGELTYLLMLHPEALNIFS